MRRLDIHDAADQTVIVLRTPLWVRVAFLAPAAVFAALLLLVVRAAWTAGGSGWFHALGIVIGLLPLAVTRLWALMPDTNVVIDQAHRTLWMDRHEVIPIAAVRNVWVRPEASSEGPVEWTVGLELDGEERAVASSQSERGIDRIADALTRALHVERLTK